MDTLLEVRHVSVSIRRSPKDVYGFVSDPTKVPEWAHGLASTLRPDGDDWVADSPMGRIRIRFSRLNELGVVDHDVTLPSGVKVHNPMRVVPNGTGSELVFSVFRQPGTPDEDFDADCAAVQRDLENVKALMERAHSTG